MVITGESSGNKNMSKSNIQEQAKDANQGRQALKTHPRDWNDPMLERRRLWDDPDIVLNRSNIEIVEHNGDIVDFVLSEEEIHKDLFKPFYGFLGVFPGFFPGMYAIRNLLVAKWNVACTVQSKSNGFVMFKFNSAEDRDMVMNGPDHYLHGKKLFMFKVAESGKYDPNILATKPVWVRLEHLPKTYWHKKALEKIATSIGEPILMDNGTLELRGYYARLLIWIDTSKQLKKMVSFCIPTGEVHKQKIIYDYCRPWCPNCGENNHIMEGCDDYWKSKEEELHNPTDLKINGAKAKGKKNWRMRNNDQIWVKKMQNENSGHSPSIGSIRGGENVLLEDASSDNEHLEKIRKGKGKIVEEHMVDNSTKSEVGNRSAGIIIGAKEGELQGTEKARQGAEEQAIDAQAERRGRSIERNKKIGSGAGLGASKGALPALEKARPGAGLSAGLGAGETDNHARDTQISHRGRSSQRHTTDGLGAGVSAKLGTEGPECHVKDAQVARHGGSDVRLLLRPSLSADPASAFEGQVPAFGVDGHPIPGAGKMPEEMVHPEARGSKLPRVSRSKSKNRPHSGLGATTRARSKSRTRVLEHGKTIQKPYQRVMNATRSNSDSSGSRSTEGGGPKPKGAFVSQ